MEERGMGRCMDGMSGGNIECGGSVFLGWVECIGVWIRRNCFIWVS